LPEYNIIFTPRRANIDDFTQLGCQTVRYLPFGYDEWLFSPIDLRDEVDGPEILFVGGADRDRAAFMKEFTCFELSVTLAGGYWGRYAPPRARSLGLQPPAELRRLTSSAKVNLCLVRRANRDGHVMRSLEIGAIGGCMLAEDTVEHRELFGPEGESVLYFLSPSEAAAKARRLIGDHTERTRLAGRLQARVRAGRHSYRDRLQTIVESSARRPDALVLGES
jgi:spore maturation protein CgeB